MAPAAAVIAVCPEATPVATPASSMVATAGLAAVQVAAGAATCWPLPVRATTENGTVAPTFTVAADGTTSSVSSSTTSTSTVSSSPPAAATICAMPTVTPRTLPAPVTDATPGASELQDTLAFGMSAASASRTSAVSV